MNYPSLVCTGEIDETRSVNEEFFENVNLVRLLTKRALDIMCRSCTSDDIEARRKVFADLDSEPYRNKCEKLFSAVGDIININSLSTTVPSDIGKAVCFIGFAEKTEALMKLLAEEKRDNLLEKALNETFDAVFDKLGGRDTFFGKLHETKELFNEFAGAEIDGAFKFSGYNGEKTKNELLRSFAEELSVDLSSPGATHRRAEPQYMAALDKKCTYEGGMIKNFRNEYAALTELPLGRIYDELGFYNSVSALIVRLKQAGISCCFPEISNERCYELSSANDISLISFENQNIVPNDISFSSADRLFFLTGANGGGKTTYIRTVAISLILFMNGCPVPCNGGKIYPFKRVFTHFSKDERFEGSGRFVEEENRINELNALCDDESFVLLNETFSGTDEQKGLRKTLWEMNELKKMGSFGLYVTHFHEINSAGYPILNAFIDESDSNRRTFRIVRSDGTKSSYAYDILKKYSLTAEDLKRRLGK